MGLDAMILVFWMLSFQTTFSLSSFTFINPDAGKDWREEEKGTTEDEMAGWHHWLDGREPEWTLGVGDGQGGLACCGSWGCKESDTTERLNWTEYCSSNKSIRTLGDFIPANFCRLYIYIYLPNSLHSVARELCHSSWFPVSGAILKCQLVDWLMLRELYAAEIVQTRVIRETQESPQVGGN